MKCVQRKNLPPGDDVAIHSEVGILGSLRHKHICPIIDFFMEDECYFIVMDLMEGGDVFDRVGELEFYDESIARDLCFKMLKAIAYCRKLWMIEMVEKVHDLVYNIVICTQFIFSFLVVFR